MLFELKENLNNSILKTSCKDNCRVCGKLTNYIDKDFGCYICSDECLDKLLSEMINK